MMHRSSSARSSGARTGRSFARLPFVLLAFAVAFAVGSPRAQDKAQPAAPPATGPAPNVPQQVQPTPLQVRTPPPRVTPPPAPASPGAPVPGAPVPQAPPGSAPERTPRPRQGAGTKSAVAGDNAAPTGQVPPPPENPIVEGANVPEPPVEEELPETEPGAKVTVIVRQQPIEKIFDTINEKAGVTVRAKGAVTGVKVDLTAKDKTVPEILNELIGSQEWTWIRREDGSYELWDKASFITSVLKQQVQRRVFRLRHVVATDVLPAVEGVKSEVGLVAANPRTNELIVTDVPDKIALVESLLAEIDVPLWTRTFRVRWADFQAIQERLEAVKSPSGSLQLDPINRVIIATDTFSKIKEMEQLLELIDKDRPIMLYNLNSIGLEGADAQEMIERFITPLVTPDTLVEFNDTQSQLLIQDIPEVHERILEVLRALDHAPRQIWIEGEILEVTQEYDLEFGADFSFSGNMSDAIKDGLIAPFVSDGSSDDGGDGDDGGSAVGVDPMSDGFPVFSMGGSGITVRSLAGDTKLELKAMMSDSNTRLLLQPRALVRNGEEVTVDLTEENPQVTTFFNGFNGGGNNNNNFASSSITFVPTGLAIALTPTISNRGLIEMEIDFENSTPIFVENIDTPQGPQDAVGRNSQRIQTVLVIPSGETRVLGGLTRRQEANSNGGVPFLSRIPYIGWLFGKMTKSNDTRNLLFFLTPTIVQEEPQVDVIQIPVNPPAKASLQDEAARPVAAPPAINPIPEEMKPFLRQTAPIRRPSEGGSSYELPAPPDRDFDEREFSPRGYDDEGGFVPGMESGSDVPELPLGESGDEGPGEIPGDASGETGSGPSALEDATGLLHDEPAPSAAGAAPADSLEGPGASMLSQSGAVGPSGTLAVGTSGGGGSKGGAPKAPARPTPPPRITPPPTVPGAPVQTPAGPPTAPGSLPGSPIDQPAPAPDSPAPDLRAPDVEVDPKA